MPDRRQTRNRQILLHVFAASTSRKGLLSFWWRVLCKYSVRVISFHIPSYPFIAFHVILCHFVSFRFISYHFLPFKIISCPFISFFFSYSMEPWETILFVSTLSDFLLNLRSNFRTQETSPVFCGSSGWTAHMETCAFDPNHIWSISSWPVAQLWFQSTQTHFSTKQLCSLFHVWNNGEDLDFENET